VLGCGHGRLSDEAHVEGYIEAHAHKMDCCGEAARGGLQVAVWVGGLLIGPYRFKLGIERFEMSKYTGRRTLTRIEALRR